MVRLLAGRQAEHNYPSGRKAKNEQRIERRLRKLRDDKGKNATIWGIRKQYLIRARTSGPMLEQTFVTEMIPARCKRGFPRVEAMFAVFQNSRREDERITPGEVRGGTESTVCAEIGERGDQEGVRGFRAKKKQQQKKMEIGTVYLKWKQ